MTPRPRISFVDRLRYSFDNLMSRGTIALIGWLAFGALAAILAVAVVVRSVGVAPEAALSEQVWSYSMQTLDADAMTGKPWALRLATLTVVLIGIFVTSTLIGIITTGMESKLASLRQGRSRVVESGHTVILGWSPEVYTVISELVEANLNQRKPCIVVLGDRDKLEMEEDIKSYVGDTQNTRVVCRRGDPMIMSDLDIASIESSEAAIILAPRTVGMDPDSFVIKTALAVANKMRGREADYNIVAEIRDPRNEGAAMAIGRDLVTLVRSRDHIARITAQTCLQSGLSAVYTDLLDFAGDEIYFVQAGSQAGKSFGESLHCFDNATVIGLMKKGKKPKLNCNMNVEITAGDKLILIARDDDPACQESRKHGEINLEAIHEAVVQDRDPENILVLGWNWRARAIIQELDKYVAPGSTVLAIAEETCDPAALDRLTQGLSSLQLTCELSDSSDLRVLEECSLDDVDHVIVLPYSDNLESQLADARSLITLLHLRNLAVQSGHRYSIVSEMLDSRNRDLAAADRPDDFVVSDRLTSLLLAQISENKQLGPVFDDLFDAEGSEIYLRPVTGYVETGMEVSFHAVVEAARRQDQVAIGYRRGEDSSDEDSTFGVKLNPTKSENVVFSAGDDIIVLSES